MKNSGVAKRRRFSKPRRSTMESLPTASNRRKKTGDSKWNDMFQIYTKHREDNGDRPVRKDQNRKLHNWVNNQRAWEKRGELRDDRKERLEAVGFEFTKRVPWNDMFDRLKAYKEVHGDCLVPQKYSDDSQLGIWVQTQRQNKDQLGEEERRKLDSIRFVWSVPNHYWDSMFDRLNAYNEAHGDCLVPERCSDDRQLGIWVRTQRTNKEKLGEEERRKLDSIRFAWSVASRPSWESMFERLSYYKKQHGNCFVTRSFDKQLNIWACYQRKNKDKLTSEQHELLESIGFEWVGVRQHKKNEKASQEEKVVMDLEEENIEGTVPVRQREESPPAEVERTQSNVNVKQEEPSMDLEDQQRPLKLEEELVVLEEPHHPIVAVKQEDGSISGHDVAAPNHHNNHACPSEEDGDSDGEPWITREIWV